MNIGNRDVTYMDLKLDFEGYSRVIETWKGTLLPADTILYIFNAKIDKKSVENADMVCVEAYNINGEEDEKPNNNKQCISMKEDFDLLPPKYDFESQQLVIGIVTDKKEEVEIQFYEVTGKAIDGFTFSITNGLNTIVVNVAQYSSGLYIYTVNNYR